MSCEVFFIDGTTEKFSNIDWEESESEEDRTFLKDSEGYLKYEVNLSQIKYIKWD